MNVLQARLDASALIVALVALCACSVQRKPISNDDVRRVVAIGTSRIDADAGLRQLEAEFLYATREKIDSEPRSPAIVWETPDAIGIFLGRVRDVRTVYYLLSSEHIEFEVEVGPDDVVSAVRVFNTYTGP